MPKKKEKPTPEKKELKVLDVSDLDQLQSLVDAPIYCQFTIDGTPIRIACRRVSQALDEEIRKIERQHQPKYNDKIKDYEYNDPAFLALRDEAKKVARSLLVYSGCPAVAAKKPGLRIPAEIHKFVKGLLTENIIELIALTIQAGGMELAERTNFTSPPASAN